MTMLASSNHRTLKVLIIEDHIDFAENLFEYLAPHPFELDFASDGNDAWQLIKSMPFDVLVIDIMIPGINGLRLCERIRREFSESIPILLMTAKGQIEDKESGFLAGADDYIVKPFHLKELKLRIEALSRRPRTSFTKVLQAGDWEFDLQTRIVCWKGVQGPAANGISAQILEILMQNYPGIVTKESIQQIVWGDLLEDIRPLRSHIYSLRQQLLKSFGIPGVKTIRQLGYQIFP